MCNKPCSLCGDYFICDLSYICANNRCRSCVHDNKDVLDKNTPCRECVGFDFKNRNKKDFYEVNNANR